MIESQIVWLGQIPSHWKLVRMKTIFENKSIKNNPDAEVLSLYRDYGVVPKKSRDDNHNVTSEDTSSYKLVNKGNLVINKMKAWQGSLAISEFDGIVSPAYYVCEFKSPEYAKKYYHYLLRCNAYAQEFECLSTGMRIGQWDLGINDFMCVPALLPPKEEQTAIAAYLDDRCNQIDNIIAETKSSIEEYKKWKAAIIFEAVTKGLDPDVEMKDSGRKRWGSIPANWSLAKVKYVAEFEPICKHDGLNKDSIVSYAPMECIRTDKRIPKTAPLSQDNGSYSSFNNGDIALAKVTPCFENKNVCIMDSLENGYAFGSSELFNLRPTNINPRFLLYWFQTEDFKEGGVASMTGVAGLKRIPASYVKNAVITYPITEEQSEIVKHLDALCNNVEELLEEKQRLIYDLEAYKKSLIYEAVTGKRKVV